MEIRTGGVVQVRNSDKIGNMGVESVLVRPWGVTGPSGYAEPHAPKQQI